MSLCWELKPPWRLASEFAAAAQWDGGPPLNLAVLPPFILAVRSWLFFELLYMCQTRPVIGGSLVTEMGLPQSSRQICRINVTNRTVSCCMREGEGWAAWLGRRPRQEVPQATHTGMAEAEAVTGQVISAAGGRLGWLECSPREGWLRDMEVKRVGVRPGRA